MEILLGPASPPALSPVGLSLLDELRARREKGEVENLVKNLRAFGGLRNGDGGEKEEE